MPAVKPTPAPLLVDAPRTQRQLARALDRVLEAHGFGPGGQDPLRSALVQVAARFGELVVQRLNAAPAAHLDAFAARIPVVGNQAQAARAVLQFNPAPGAQARRVTVPLGTRASAAPPPGDAEPVVFETVEDLSLVRAMPTQAWAVAAGHLRCAELKSMGGAGVPAGAPLTFDKGVDRALHLAVAPAFLPPGLRQIQVQFNDVDAGSPGGAGRMAWTARTKTGEQPVDVVSDSTAGLTQSGTVVLTAPAAWAPSVRSGRQACWLSLRQLSDGEGALAQASAGIPPTRPPTAGSIQLTFISASSPPLPVVACCDGAPLDTTKDFFPFGEVPRLGAAFELTSPMFETPGTRVEISFKLSTLAPPPAKKEAGAAASVPRLVWEVSTATGFRAVSSSDEKNGFTEDGTVVLGIPSDAAPVTIAGQRGVWIRARLSSGHYGFRSLDADGKVKVPRGPVLRTLAVATSLSLGPVAPDAVWCEGALEVQPVVAAARIPAFTTPDVPGPSLYIALQALPGAQGELQEGVVLSCQLGASAASLAGLPDVAPTWQARSSHGWRDLEMIGAKHAAASTGIVKLRWPQGAAAWPLGQLDAAAGTCWIRAHWPPGTDLALAMPRAFRLNCVAAVQGEVIRNEILGTSHGSAHQRFRAKRAPVVGEVQLQVMEDGEHWLTWAEVSSFESAQPEDRVFMLDRHVGVVTFGDGRRGRVPPVGERNLRLAWYRTGGGTRGNLPPGAVTQLGRAIPAVAAVINPERTDGGMDIEPSGRVRGRAAAWLRHRSVAVCPQDYADLACAASPQVARAYCVPRPPAALPGDLASAVAGDEGTVAVVVVPSTHDARPQPVPGLLRDVQAYLDARRPPVGQLVVRAPAYAGVSVRARLRAMAGWSPIELAQRCADVLAHFLHPVDGGDGGTGWAPGERPHRSDFFGLLGAIDGVELVREVTWRLDVPDDPGLIVAAGTIDISSGD